MSEERTIAATTARVFPSSAHHPRCAGHETIMGETACIIPPAIVEADK